MGLPDRQSRLEMQRQSDAATIQRVRAREANLTEISRQDGNRVQVPSVSRIRALAEPLMHVVVRYFGQKSAELPLSLEADCILGSYDNHPWLCSKLQALRVMYGV